MMTSSRRQITEAAHSETQPLPREGGGIRRILVCLDRSPFAEVCVPHAVSLARTFGSAITLLHVMQPHERSTDPFDWEFSQREAINYLEQMQKEAARASEQQVDTRLEQGHPAERILALTRDLKADVTVLGSHGEGGLTAWSLGSTIQEVLAVGRCSVLVARSNSQAPGSVAPKRILVPLDGSVRTESVLPTAARIAKAHGAELLLVHVALSPLPTAMLRAPADLKLARELASRVELVAGDYLAHLREQLVREGVSVRTLVLRDGDESQSLIDILQKEKVDLVVLSAHGSTCNPARPFGGVAVQLLTDSMVTLLVLQDLPALERPRSAADGEIAPPLRASFHPRDV